MEEMPAGERIILAVDTSAEDHAERLTSIAQEAGARFVKYGLELSSSTSWRYCSELASEHDLDWVADAKLDDIPNTVTETVRNIAGLEHPPFGITMHTTAGIEAMRLAQREAGDVKMLGVTILTSIQDNEAERIYHAPVQQKVQDLAYNAAEAGMKGIVSSPREVGLIKSNPLTGHLFAMTPGVRSSYAITHDQSRTSTPSAAIRNGADLVVIGRQITLAEDPVAAYERVVQEIEGTL